MRIIFGILALQLLVSPPALASEVAPVEEQPEVSAVPWFAGFACRAKDLYSGFRTEETAWTLPVAAAKSLAVCHEQAGFDLRVCVPVGCYPIFD